MKKSVLERQAPVHALPASHAMRNVMLELLDASPDSLVVVDDACTVALINTAAERLLGYPCHELVGQPFGVLIAEADRDAALTLLAKTARLVLDEPDQPALEVVARRKDGAEIPVEVSLSSFRRGSRTFVVGAVRDIRVRKRFERERFELLVREQTARQQAEAAVRMRDAFLATVTHDLRQPLTLINARAELVRDIASELTDDEAADTIRHSADRIAAASTRMSGALRELIDVARLQSGSPLGIERSSVDLAELAQHVVSEQRVLDRGPIVLQAPEEPLVGMWDEKRLERVLHNLIDNAMKYSPDRCGVTVCVRRDVDCAVIEVSDAGIGIPPADLEHVFEWFRRGSNVAGVAPGAGIGLAGVRQIVVEHGGVITVRSREGAGSTFVVRLPIGGVESS